MLLLLIATLMGHWSYEGFASDPAPAAAVLRGSAPPEPSAPGPIPPESAPPVPPVRGGPTPADMLDPPAPLPALPIEIDVAPAVAEKPPPVRKPAPPKTIRPEVPARPKLWHLVDVRGQVWEHANPDALRRWVAYRNASLTGYWITPWYEPVMAQPHPVGTCPSGHCPLHR